ncbi:FAD binding domain-containing protein [Haladaptatus sp. ZSTT2]|uniref:FAD binding domain-containing protein n=1 Tax=Haladaptatus sp. ZSTT2 TaxID=3120515 RepID=UPI00300EB791
MYPSEFKYLAAESVDDALTLIADHEFAEILAGGQSLIPLQKERLAMPDYVIDISEIAELDYIEETADEIRLGAVTTHTTAEESELVREHVFIFSECISKIADRLVRNRGTVGGTVVEADPDGDYMPVMKLLNPDVVVTGPDGERVIPFSEFYIGMFTVDIEEDELLTEVRLPKLPLLPEAAGVGSTYKKHVNRSGDYAIVGVAALVHVDDDGSIIDARVTIGSVGPLLTSEGAADAVVGTKLDEASLEAAADAVEAEVMPDQEGRLGAYKRAMAGEFTQQALRTAYERALADSQ